VDIIPIKDKLRFYSQLIDINESNTLYKNISRSRSFIKIQDGCNNRCTYCAVHVARGISISRAQDEVIKEIHHVHSLGFKEVVLTGVNIGMYGWDLLPPSSLNTLLRIVLSSTEIPRIRLSSLEVNEIDDELIDIITNDRICRHLHIPLQSGCDKILKRMGRKYTVNYFEQKIEKIVSLFPDISIGSDIITGFPGEGDNSFIKTADFVRRNSFSYLHVFPYSMRDNTPASNFPDQVPDKIKQERVQELRGIASAKKIKYMEKFIGRTLDVIVEKKIDNSLYQATSGNYLKVRIASDGLERGVLLFTRIFGFQNGHLLGVPILMT
jgi:threonylcarbamoyladenosine tRNA methylthiotransferase MtaB